MSIFLRKNRKGIIGFPTPPFAGNALGPMIATSLLAFSTLPTLYLFISLIALSALLGFGYVFRHPPVEAKTH
jgi:hypothetical protein